MTAKRQKRRYREARRLGVVVTRAEFDQISASVRARGRVSLDDMDALGLDVDGWLDVAAVFEYRGPYPPDLSENLVQALASACGMPARLLAPMRPDDPAQSPPRGQPG